MYGDGVTLVRETASVRGSVTASRGASLGADAASDKRMVPPLSVSVSDASSVVGDRWGSVNFFVADLDGFKCGILS